MRLIDIDKLHYIRKWFEDSGKSEVVVFAKEIDKAPTVKAIPVEWIEKWSRQFYDKNGRYNGEGYDSVWDLLEDWEKENANIN